MATFTAETVHVSLRGMHDLPPPEFDNAAVVTDAVVMMNYAFTNDVEFEMLSLGAMVRNVMTFLESRTTTASTVTSSPAPKSTPINFGSAMNASIAAERPATPEDAAGKSREVRPESAGASRPSFAMTEFCDAGRVPNWDDDGDFEIPKSLINSSATVVGAELIGVPCILSETRPSDTSSSRPQGSACCSEAFWCWLSDSSSADAAIGNGGDEEGVATTPSRRGTSFSAAATFPGPLGADTEKLHSGETIVPVVRRTSASDLELKLRRELSSASPRPVSGAVMSCCFTATVAISGAYREGSVDSEPPGALRAVPDASWGMVVTAKTSALGDTNVPAVTLSNSGGDTIERLEWDEVRAPVTRRAPAQKPDALTAQVLQGPLT